MSCYLVLLTITIFILRYLINCQIIIEDTKVCYYQSSSKFLPFNEKVFSVPYQNQYIYLSLCSVSIKQKCDDREVSTCLSNGKKGSLNLGKYFIYTKDLIHKNEFLKSVGGESCRENPNKTYTVIIHLANDDFLIDGPLFSEVKNCEYHIRILNPSAYSKCTTRIGKSLVDLQNFDSLDEIEIKGNDNIFYIKLCSPSSKCINDNDRQVSACKLIDFNKKEPILDYETQHLNYYNYVLSVRGRWESGSKGKYSEFFLNCDWEEKKVKGSLRRTYSKKFEFDLYSKHFCIIPPSDCTVTKDDYHFNINNLKRNSNPWTIKISNGEINLNICGPLHKNFGKCKEQFSQVCFKGGDNEQFINLGSLQKELVITDDYTLKLNIIYGSKCNDEDNYNTEIEFFCSDFEQGPELIPTNVTCKYNIIWRTPTACPIHVIKSSTNDCDLLGKNVSAIYSNTDRIIPLDSNSRLRLNFCGPLRNPCDEYENVVSACFEKNGKETVAGWNNKNLLSVNGILTLKLEDETKKSGFKTVVNFYCNLSATLEGVTSLESYSENRFVIGVQTPLACVRHLVTDCKVSAEGNETYDLSPLKSNDKNYVVRDDNDEYILNLCRTIVNDKNHFCPVNSPVCWKRIKEPNIIYKYVRLGSLSKPKWVDGNLKANYENGGYCKAKLQDTFSRIHFVCSSEEKQPELLRKDECSVEFVWYTKYACGKYSNMSSAASPYYKTESGMKQSIKTTSKMKNLLESTTSNSINYLEKTDKTEKNKRLKPASSDEHSDKKLSIEAKVGIATVIIIVTLITIIIALSVIRYRKHAKMKYEEIRHSFPLEKLHNS